MKNLDFRIKMILAATCFLIIHVAVIFLTGIGQYLTADVFSGMPVFIIVAESVMLAAEIFINIFARIKKYTSILKGLFLFKLVGMVFFVIAWAISLKSGSTTTGFFTVTFNWFAAGTIPLATLLTPIFHVSSIFRRGIVFGIMTYLPGAMVRSIRKEQKFEEKMAEKKALEQSE